MLKNFKYFFKKNKYKLFSDKRIALIKLDGIIIDSVNLPVVSKITESFDMVKKLGIKTVVLRINSPGGTVGASQEIYNAILRLKNDNIKVVISLGDVAASGGIYIAVAGDKIVSNPGTVTGSIGVIIKTRVIKELYGKIGIDHEIIKSGQFKDILSDTKYLSDEDKAILQNMVDDTYKQFVETIAQNRNIDVETVKSFADGRIFTGLQAKEYGLIDEIGSQADAIDQLQNLQKSKVSLLL